jgi:hypothetical protein
LGACGTPADKASEQETDLPHGTLLVGEDPFCNAAQLSPTVFLTAYHCISGSLDGIHENGLYFQAPNNDSSQTTIDLKDSILLSPSTGWYQDNEHYEDEFTPYYNHNAGDKILVILEDNQTMPMSAPVFVELDDLEWQAIENSALLKTPVTMVSIFMQDARSAEKEYVTGDLYVQDCDAFRHPDITEFFSHNCGGNIAGFSGSPIYADGKLLGVNSAIVRMQLGKDPMADLFNPPEGESRIYGLASSTSSLIEYCQSKDFCTDLSLE